MWKIGWKKRSLEFCYYLLGCFIIFFWWKKVDVLYYEYIVCNLVSLIIGGFIKKLKFCMFLLYNLSLMEKLGLFGLFCIIKWNEVSLVCWEGSE